MANADKLLERMRANPRDRRIEDVAALCDGFGIACTPPRKGSHYKVKHVERPEILTIPADQADLHSGIGAVHRRSAGITEMNPFDYEVDILPLSAADGGGYTAVAPELPGCRSDGETPQEALDNIYDAIGCWIEAAREMGRPVPQPRRAAA